MGERDKRPPEVERSLEDLKDDVTEDLGLDDDVRQRGWARMTTREVGRIGGNMVKRLIRRGERSMADTGERDDQRRD